MLPCALYAVQFGAGVGQELEQDRARDVDALAVELADRGVVVLRAEAGAQIGKPLRFALGSGEEGVAAFGKQVCKLRLAVAKVHGWQYAGQNPSAGRHEPKADKRKLKQMCRTSVHNYFR